MANNGNIIIRGTTPTVMFRYKDINVEDITVANLYIKQDGQDVITRDIGSMFRSGTAICWTLTQEETLSLAPTSCVMVCDWKLVNGLRGRSEIATAKIGEPGKAEVI